MTVRLAFAVAAFLEPEILVIDEVLAVGGAEFQKKAIEKMPDFSKGEGRTVLFVSHNMAAVKQLCTRGIVLEHGMIKYDGNIDEALDIYNSNLEDLVPEVKWDIENAAGNLNAKVTSVKLVSDCKGFFIENQIRVEIEYVNFVDNQKINCSISIFDHQNTYVLASPNLERSFLEKGRYKSVCIIPENFLNKGKYFFSVILVGNNFEIIAQLDNVVAIDIDEQGIYRKDYFGFWGGIVRPYLNWENTKIGQ